MNYPSLSLSAESIERAFSEKKNISLPKTITGKKDKKSEPQDQSYVKNGGTKDCYNCDFKTSKYEDLFDHIRQSHFGQGKKHKCPECNFTNSTLFRIKRHLYEVHLKIGQMKKCDHCDYTNITYNNLYVHKRQHQIKATLQSSSSKD